MNRRQSPPENVAIDLLDLDVQYDSLTATLWMQVPLQECCQGLKCLTQIIEFTNVTLQMRIDVIQTQNQPVNLSLLHAQGFNVIIHYDYVFSVKIVASNNSEGIVWQFHSECLGVSKKVPSSTENFYIIHECEGKSHRSNIINFDVNFKVTVDESNPVMMFASIVDDTEMTDFELSVADGSLKVHKAVLAAASPVLRSMLRGEWKGTQKGSIHVPETSKATLENFKRYLYMRAIPNTGCEQLLLLADFYQMPALEERCIKQIVMSANVENIIELCEFASFQQMRKLLAALLTKVKSGRIEVPFIKNQLKDKSPNTRVPRIRYMPYNYDNNDAIIDLTNDERK